jgi:hypothetical protein
MWESRAIHDTPATSVNWDDLLGQTVTGRDGAFDITGRQNELGYLRPYLYITHTCPSMFEEYQVRE